MNNNMYRYQSFYKIRWVMLLLVAAHLFQIDAKAQEKKQGIEIDSAKVILDKSLEFDTETEGILKRIQQSLKFRENRDNSEKQRIYEFLLKRIDEGDLKIDKATVDQIMIQLDKINSSTVLNKDSIEKIKVNIENIISKNASTTKASKEVIDSLKTQMSAVVIENAINNSKEKREILQEANDFLREIRDVQYSESSGLFTLDSFPQGDTLRIKIKKNLEPKIMIIAWHNSWLNDDEFLRYNYNYLSAINLYGYELAPDGTCKEPGFIADFEKKNGVIETAHKKGAQVHLTVYNKFPAEISKFLNDTLAQNILTSKLNSLISKNNLRGINLFFEDVSLNDSKQFVQFVEKLHRNLKAINDSIQLNISIPAKTDDKSLTKINAYNIEELIPVVDYFLILTDNLIGRNIRIAQSSSPLFNSNKYRNYSIESAISYYNQLGIPVSKQIMTVSYSGVEWVVNDFTGVLKSTRKRDTTYAEIIKNYSVNNENGLTVTEGFDPDQVAAFLNIIGKNPNDLRQVWFEDSRSLFLKYNWALENKLGGVSIRGLGYDDGHSELWDVLGASLLKIDTTFVDSISLKKPEPLLAKEKIRFPILVNAWNGFEFKTFLWDFRWSKEVRLKYNDGTTYTDEDGIEKKGYKRFNPKFNESVGNIKDTVNIKYLKDTIIWTQKMPFEKDTSRYNEGFLENKSYCYSLYARWKIYARFFMWFSIIFGVLSLIFGFISKNTERYILGSAKVRSIVRIVPFVLSLITIISISFWLYYEPSIVYFGAGSDKGTSFLITIYFVVAAIFVSWWFTSKYYKYRSR